MRAKTNPHQASRESPPHSDRLQLLNWDRAKRFTSQNVVASSAPRRSPRIDNRKPGRHLMATSRQWRPSRGLAFLGCLFALSSCGSAGLQSSSASPTASPTAASPRFPSPPGPTGFPTPMPTAVSNRTVSLLVNFNCQLPARIAVGTVPGFLDLRTGHFASDPSAGSQEVVTYSWPSRRWLPVRYDLVAPDQLHYAYIGEVPSYPPQSQGNLHVVDIAGGTDRIVLKGGQWTQSSGVWGIIRFATEGIYLQKEAYASEGNWGVWLVDPSSGAIREIFSESIGNTSFGSGAAWTGNDLYTSTQVFRIDPTTGERVLWFSKPNPWLWYAGSDASGRPLIQWIPQAPAPSELWVLSGPYQGSRLYSGPQSSIPFPSEMAADSRGVWSGSLSGSSVLWLLTTEDQLVKVADTPVEVLGSCQ
jgi:hypothetical protein